MARHAGPEMKYFFDTSVLVAATVEAHAGHAASFALLEPMRPKNAFCSAHTLVELYSVLTRMPGLQKIPPASAMVMVNSVRQYLTPVVLTTEETVDALDRLSEIGVAGGKTYDGLLFAAAKKMAVHVFYTWNTKDFMPLVGQTGITVQSPIA
jgi:predicted nucleic acid-binding protein